MIETGNKWPETQKPQGVIALRFAWSCYHYARSFSLILSRTVKSFWPYVTLTLTTWPWVWSFHALPHGPLVPIGIEIGRVVNNTFKKHWQYQYQYCLKKVLPIPIPIQFFWKYCNTNANTFVVLHNQYQYFQGSHKWNKWPPCYCRLLCATYNQSSAQIKYIFTAMPALVTV